MKPQSKIHTPIGIVDNSITTNNRHDSMSRFIVYISDLLYTVI